MKVNLIVYALVKLGQPNFFLDQHIVTSVFNVCRCEKSRGGGVCIYVRYIFTVTVFNVNVDRIEGIKDLWLTVQCQKKFLP